MSFSLNSLCKSYFFSPGLVLFSFLCLHYWLNQGLDFPLNDDWNYARAVYICLREGRLELPCWTLAASLTNIGAGIIMSLIAGFSFVQLHFVTVAWSLIAAGSLIYGLWKLKASIAFTTLSITTLLFNPFFLPLSFTFMTDISFLALSSLLLLCLAGLLVKPGQKGWLIASAILCILTVLDRQVGIVIPLSFSLLQLLTSKDRKQLRKDCWHHLPLLSAILCLLGFHYWLEAQHWPLFSYQTEKAYLAQLFSQGFIKIISHILRNVLVAILYMGFLLFPLLCFISMNLFPQLEQTRRKFLGLLFGEIFLLLGLVFVCGNATMPLADNLLNSYGSGPLFFSHINSNIMPRPLLPDIVLLTITAATAAGTAILGCLGALIWLDRKAFLAANSPAKDFSSQLQSLLLLFCLIYLVVICIRGFFDRYLLNLLPAAIWLLALQQHRSTAMQNPGEPAQPAFSAGLIVSLIAALALSTFTVLSTSDYLGWNKAKWALLNHCRNFCTENAMQIDGGLEFNGWYAYDSRYKTQGVVFNPSMTHGNLYMVAPAVVTGYTPVRSATYRTFLPAKNNQLLLLKREAATSP